MDRFHLMHIFVRIVESGSFSKVATELSTQQSSISKQLSSLENIIGVRLLNRTTRKLSLTDAGREYFERCKRIVDQVAELDADVGSLQNAPSGTIKINGPLAFGHKYLVPIIFKFRKLYPDIRFDFTLKDRAIDLIQEGVDISIQFGEMKDSQLIARHLGSFARVCVASSEYLKNNPKINTPLDLVNHNCITYTYYDTNNDWFFTYENSTYPVRVQGDFKTNSSYSILESAINGIGIANLPYFMVKKNIEQNQLTVILKAYGPNDMRMNAVYTSARLLSRKVKLLVNFIEKECSLIKELQPQGSIKVSPKIRSNL